MGERAEREEHAGHRARGGSSPTACPAWSGGLAVAHSGGFAAVATPVWRVSMAAQDRWWRGGGSPTAAPLLQQIDWAVGQSKRLHGEENRGTRKWVAICWLNRNG